MTKDRGLELFINVAMAACSITAFLIYMAGWQDDTSATVFVLCLGYLTLLAFARR